jgi:hypothetical protein
MITALMGALLVGAAELPEGAAPKALDFPHFPSRVHAFVWRNWQLVPAQRMAEVIGAQPEDVVRMGRTMGLSGPPEITPDQQKRSYITVIRRNWHLLPYDQMLKLLGWTADELAFTLREDDFLYIKLGLLKPKCEPLTYSPPDDATRRQEEAIARVVREEFPEGVGSVEEPLFHFVAELSEPPAESSARVESRFSPRFCSSYFALYGDPLLDTGAGPYPDGYLARLVASGVDGVWLQGVLYKLAVFPWQPELSERHEERLDSLRRLVERARRQGVGLYLYLNEPRAMPLSFYEQHPELKGVVEGDHAALCTSVPEVREYIRESIASICRAVPDLAGFFTITASENLTNCWSHHRGMDCPRCKDRAPAEVIAEVNATIREGIAEAGAKTRLLAWDWGWQNEWAEAAIAALPKDVALMSVSEWDLPIERGGIKGTVGEYSISAVGPGPRAKRHWGAADAAGLDTIAKIQAGNTWELSSVPYIPAVANVAQHAANLREAGVDGLMLGWTLGGYPSPNLEVVAEMGRAENPPTPEDALRRVAERRFGPLLAPAVVDAWRECSRAFREFPYNIGTVYTAPLQMGPANLLWGAPTGFAATMVGIPYDDLKAWRSIYPADVFAMQLQKVADGFNAALESLRGAAASASLPADGPEAKALANEMTVIEAAAIHFESAAVQSRFVALRDKEAAASSADAAKPIWEELGGIIGRELALAKRLHALQREDSRLGFEATNQYFYVPVDLAEKVLNCRDLLDRWLTERRARFGG